VYGKLLQLPEEEKLTPRQSQLLKLCDFLKPFMRSRDPLKLEKVLNLFLFYLFTDFKSDFMGINSFKKYGGDQSFT
jgi:hypothetical protein